MRSALEIAALAGSAVILYMALIYLKVRFLDGVKPPKGKLIRVGYGSLIKRVFWDFPHRLVTDWIKRNPAHFRDFGVHVIAGEQGSGKTITLVYLLKRYKKLYPSLLIKTNMSYYAQDAPIEHWRDLIDGGNGELGEIMVIDELSSWFSSLDSKSFPAEMLTEITQQRKQRKMILGTTQVFTRTSKQIREQTTMLYEPFTLFGCVTIVPIYKAQLDDVGALKKKKFRRIFFFVQSDELRESFNTWEKISRYAEEGFKEQDVIIVR
jgi:ATP-dependent Clp protease ATP-binding subunit ClpX